VQQEFPSRVIFELAYVGMLSLKELESFNLNDLPTPLNVATQNNQVANPFFGVFASNSSLGAAKTIPQKNLQVAFPQFTTLTEDGVNSGTSTYHAMSTRVEKRLTHSVSVIGTYTWSKLMHNKVTSLVNKSCYHNSLVNYRSISQFDQPQLVRITGFYIRAGGDYPVMQYGDQYGSIYQHQALPPNGTVVVKLNNPDLVTSWQGRVGIIVRNDISKPAYAAGYVILASSPAAGSYLEWSTDDSGRLNRHTEF
jgi:hypothetical protein